MALFNLRRKGGSGKGTVVETNPNVARKSPSVSKPAFPGEQLTSALRDWDSRNRPYGSSSPYIDKNKKTANHTIAEVGTAQVAHNEGRYGDAVNILRNATLPLHKDTGTPARDGVFEQHVENYARSINSGK